MKILEFGNRTGIPKLGEHEREARDMVYIYVLRDTTGYMDIDNKGVVDYINVHNIPDHQVHMDSADDTRRSNLVALKEQLEEGDELVLRSIQDLSHTPSNVGKALKYLHNIGVKVTSVEEEYYNYEGYYRAYLDFIGISDVLKERKRLLGIATAKRERKLGRKKNIEKIDKAIRLYDTERFTVKEVLEIADISSSTLYRELDRRSKDKEAENTESKECIAKGEN